MEELKQRFIKLDKKGKIKLMQEIMPEFCKMFNENPQEMMKDFKMDKSMRMSMMNQNK